MTQTQLSKLINQQRPILIIGSTGTLGSDLVQYFKQKLGEEKVIGTDSSELDITDPVMLLEKLELLRPSLVINASGYTDVDLAEKEREKAYNLNVIGLSNLVSLCNSMGVKLVHFSSDYVFDGTLNRPLTEDDTPFPVKPNFYAETKLLGEIEVLKYSENLVLRLQWLYGKTKNRFSILADIEGFSPFSDQYGTPQWTMDVAKIVFELLEKNAMGLFHFSYDDYGTREDVYKFIKSELELVLKIDPKPISEANLAARRPQFCILSNKKICQFLGKQGLGLWRDSLREFLRQNL